MLIQKFKTKRIPSPLEEGHFDSATLKQLCLKSQESLLNHSELENKEIKLSHILVPNSKKTSSTQRQKQGVPQVQGQEGRLQSETEREGRERDRERGEGGTARSELKREEKQFTVEMKNIK